MAFRQGFFRYILSDQNSSIKISINFYIVPVGPGNRTKKVPFFPRSIQYRARLKGPPFSFFGIVQFFSTKGSPFQFFGVLAECMLENSKGFPCQFFRHCEQGCSVLSRPSFKRVLNMF